MFFGTPRISILLEVHRSGVWYHYNFDISNGTLSRRFSRYLLKMIAQRATNVFETTITSTPVKFCMIQCKSKVQASSSQVYPLAPKYILQLLSISPSSEVYPPAPKYILQLPSISYSSHVYLFAPRYTSSSYVYPPAPKYILQLSSISICSQEYPPAPRYTSSS